MGVSLRRTVLSLTRAHITMPPKAPANAGAGKKKPPLPAKQAQAQPAHGGSVQQHHHDPAGHHHQGNAGFLPPGACQNSRDRRNVFANEFEPHFHVPKRLQRVPTPLVEAVNDFHFAMMNDLPRNEFYYGLLKKHVTPETGVLEIGAGSGLLSMMAAKLGAKWVVAVEGSADMADLARRNVHANGLQDKIKVMCMMSTDLDLKHLPGQPDILVSEIFGTLLLGESAHDYIEDIRRRVLKPSSVILPRHGVQYAVPIQCDILDSIADVKTWNGLDLSHVTAVKDTASTVFTKKYGFRMSSVPFKKLSAPIPVVTIDFQTTKRKDFKRNQSFEITATESGQAHAMLLYWEATDDGLVMSTDPDATRDNFPRDMQWGQALQLIDAGNEALPAPFVVEKGDAVSVTCRSSNDGVLLQFGLKHAAAKVAKGEDAAPAAGEAAAATTSGQDASASAAAAAAPEQATE
jgi:protein arginine N-methyltransferase 7